MRIYQALFALVVLAGCAGSATTPNPASATGAALSALPSTGRDRGSGITHENYPTKGVLLFVADINNHWVAIYPRGFKQNPAPIATITAGIYTPYGLAIDKTGTLYVADNGTGSIKKYPKGSTNSTGSITDGISSPLDLAIDREGTLYVVDASLEGIVEYPFGKTKPSKTITGRGLNHPLGIALDAKGNLFVADYRALQVFKIPRGTSQIIPLNLQGFTGRTAPLGVAVDPSGNLWVTNGNVVYVYAPGSQTPSHTIGLTGAYAVSIDESGKVAISTFAQDSRAVYVIKPGTFVPFAVVTNGINTPVGVLLKRP